MKNQFESNFAGIKKEEIKATISGFAEAALKAGDNDTYNLAQQITQNF